ncbi:MAG: hypothetical protein U0169_20005 [Polyangiaceae bacterium]
MPTIHTEAAMMPDARKVKRGAGGDAVLTLREHLRHHEHHGADAEDDEGGEREEKIHRSSSFGRVQ